MAAMGSVQEGSEGGSIGSEVVVQQEDSGLEQGTPARTDGSSRDEGDEVWWMSEDAHSGMEAARGTSHSTNNSVTRERRHSGEEEEWRRNGSSLWKEWMREREEWREKEAGWRKEAEELRERYARLEEEKRIEVDMLRAKVLEMEVSTTMADWASVGVQATGEEGALKVDEEEKMDEIRRENEQLKIALEKMRVSCVDEEGGGRTFSKCEFCSKERRSASVGESNFQPRHDDDLKREYESQIRNVRELRGMYEERMKAAEEQSKKLREDLQEKSRRLELSRRRCSELRAHSQELETLLGEQEGVAKGLQTRLSASLEEGRALASQLATVNRLFGRLGDTAELDFERLRLLQNSVSEEGKDECDRRSVNESSSVCGNGGNAKQEGSELREIAASLPKVWRLLVELLGEEQKEEEASEGTADADGCFDSVPTPYGPRLVISVSRTFIRLKDLILEKKTLQNELGRIRDLNGRLESKLKQQERRLATVKVELKRTWGLVGRMRAQHKQLHTSEQVLRYELQQKRKLLGELKQELEYCREKWELARIKNSQSEKEWQLLRQEFTARRSGDAEPSTEVLDNVNSPESGFSDGRGEDEEDDDEDPQAVECVGENEMDGGDRAGNSKASEDKDNLHCEENQTLPIDLNLLGQELNIYTDNPSPSSVPPDPGEDTGGNSASVSNDETDTKETSSSPPSSRESSNAGTSSPETGSQQAGGASAERSMEERLQARAERLRRLEEQCDLLFRKVTRTTTRSAELSSRLEELHEQYGDQQPSSSGEDGRTEDGQVVADIETGEIQPEKESSVGLHPLRESYLTGEGRSDSESSSGSSGFPPLRESVLMRPPTPPPLPGSSNSSQFSPLEERVAVRPPTPPPLPGSSSSSQFSPLEERVAVRPPTPPPLPSSLPAIRLPSLVDHSSISDSALPSEAETPVSVSSNVNNETRSEVCRPNQQLLLDKSVESSNRESSSSDYHQLRVDSEDNRASVPNLANDSTTEEPPLTMETIQEESIPASSIPSSLFPQSDFEDMSETNENMESEDLAGEGSETSREEEEMLDEEDESIVGLSRDRSREGSMEEDEEREDEEAYLAGMSDTIYGLHHGPLFDDGMSPSDDDNDEEECAQGGIAEEEDIEDTDEEEGMNTTPGSIGVASLLLQQLPKRMDILRRERRSLEQRLEEGEAALGRAMASSAAAERRARVLERGLAQAHERVRVLEMEAAVERNERLLEIKSALDASSPSSGSGDSNEGRQSNRLQEEIDNLQRQTLAQIAEFQAAALVSKAQKEQLCNLNDEIERQEKVVKCLEEEVASLRKEREEQSTALKDSRVRLKEALVLAAKSQEEADNKQLQIDKLKAESELSSKENAGLHSRLTAAESEISRLNAEIVQLKEDSDRLREAVVRLTGDKEALFRSKHNLEEMRRLVLEDSRWVADKEMDECTACGVTFSLMVRRHHCRSCGKIFCGACSSHWLALNSASSASQPASLVAGVVESLMGVAGKRSRACADCFAAYSGENAECLEPSTSSINHSQVGASNEEQPCSSKSLQGEQPEGSGESGLSAAGAVVEDEDDEEEDEDFSMISEEEVVLSQCTPYVPNPRTLQYWKSCEIQSGVMSSASDLLAACAADGAGKGEEVWVRAGAIYSVPLLIEETRVNIHWEFSTNPNSIAFSVLYKTSADIPMSCALIVVPTTRVNSHLNPVRGRLRPKRAGVYILMFDNSFSRFTGKTISYCLKAEVPSRGASGRESVTNSSRSSVEPFPDLPVHPEETDEHGVVSGETDGEVKVTTEESHVDDQG